jgi:hypothetical protein
VLPLLIDESRFRAPAAALGSGGAAGINVPQQGRYGRHAAGDQGGGSLPGENTVVGYSRCAASINRLCAVRLQANVRASRVRKKLATKMQGEGGVCLAMPGTIQVRI